MADGRIGYFICIGLGFNQLVIMGKLAIQKYRYGGLVVEVAKMYLGVPYVYGGTSPNGFDCSGLMQFVYKYHIK